MVSCNGILLPLIPTESRYMGWKSMLDPQILRDPSIKFYLNQALDMMNRAVAGTFQPGARENMAYFISTEKRSVADDVSSEDLSSLLS